jgi:hypothetical protein
MTTRQVSLSLDEDLVGRLKADAERRGVSLSSLVNRTLADTEIIAGLDEHFALKRDLGLLDPSAEAARLAELRAASERLASAA